MNRSFNAVQWFKKPGVQNKIVLAIDPTVKGFGFAVFRGPQEPLDWGTTDIRISKNYRSLRKFRRLVGIYNPDVIVVESPTEQSSHRCTRINTLIVNISELAEQADIQSFAYSPDQVREVFSHFGVTTKYRIANKIAKWLPELSERTPEKRKNCDPESMDYAIFDAAALAITYFYLEESLPT